MKTHIIRKYECPTHSYFDALVKFADRLKPQKCPRCRKKCESTFMQKQINALPKATIVYEKVVDGKKERLYVDPAVPESIEHAAKEGYERREIQGMKQAREFEREVSREMRREYEQNQEVAAAHREEVMRQAHSELRGMMSQMDAFSREVAREALKDSGDAPRNYSPDFRIGAYN